MGGFVIRVVLVLTLLLAIPSVVGSPARPVAALLEDETGIPAGAIPPRDATLADLVARADARFGIVRLPSDYAPLADLDPALADVTADLLSALLFAADERDAAFAGVDDAELDAALRGEAAPGLLARVDIARVRAAAGGLASALDAARLELVRLAPAPRAAVALAPAPLIDLFPVLGIDPLGVPNAFPHDYFLSIDLGGDDVYDNNAGGSILQRGQSVGEPSTWGPTVENPGGDLPPVRVGDIFFDAGGDIIVGGEFEEGEAVHTATLAIDVAGNDVYGVYKLPSAAGTDRVCTSEPVIRRVVIQGSGGGGIGILADLAGDDQYRAKTLGQGMGHVAGVGILLDAGGDDRYTAVRSARGVGLLGGVGLFVDESGNDLHDVSAPAGGIFNQPDERCDAVTRLAMGVGALTGIGVFLERAGDDIYRVQSKALGHADPQSLGVFVDAAGSDDYGGFVARSNGGQFTTTPAGGAGVFRDLE